MANTADVADGISHAISPNDNDSKYHDAEQGTNLKDPDGAGAPELSEMKDLRSVSEGLS